MASTPSEQVPAGGVRNPYNVGLQQSRTQNHSCKNAIKDKAFCLPINTNTLLPVSGQRCIIDAFPTTRVGKPHSVELEEKIYSNRSSDNAMKDRVFCVPINMSTSRCKLTCGLGKNCVGDTLMSEIRSLQEHFWGTRDAPAPTSQQRHERIVKILEGAYVLVPR